MPNLAKSESLLKPGAGSLNLDQLDKSSAMVSQQEESSGCHIKAKGTAEPHRSPAGVKMAYRFVWDWSFCYGGWFNEVKSLRWAPFHPHFQNGLAFTLE